jgi:proline iminopeptidase
MRGGSGTPIIFLHEFAADHTNWEPQMRYFSRGHRCIAYSARGYTPSDVPPDAAVYTYKHFYTDALAVLDHLGIAKAHFIGLSMGSYSSLQVGLNAPERALSMTLAAVGSGSGLENLDAFRAQCRANAEQYEAVGSVEVAKLTREAPSRIPFLLKDPRGHADFYAALARHDAKGSANTMRSFQGGRPSIYTMTDAIRKVPTPALILCGDEDDNCVGPEPVPEAASAGGGAVVLSEVGPRAQSGRAGAVQRDGGALHRAGRGRKMAGARSEVDGEGGGLKYLVRPARERQPGSAPGWCRAAA